MGNSSAVFSPAFFQASAPIVLLAIASLVAMMQSVIRSMSGVVAVRSVLIGSLVLALFMAASQLTVEPMSFLQGTFIAEGLGRFGAILILLISLITAFLFQSSHLASFFYRGEISAIFLIVVTGGLVTVTSDDLITLFVGLEMASIGIYALVGYIHPSRTSAEGAIKYFVLGGFASAFLLFGIALLFVATGTLSISGMVGKLTGSEHHVWAMLGGIFLLVGLAFKFALAPFHLWAPDAYEGAPTPLTAFMATAVKAMILVVFVRFFAQGMDRLQAVWYPSLVFVAACSMIFGNLLGLVQSSLKRMLAYSSVAHGGYMAVALAAVSAKSGQMPIAAVLFYIVAYTILTLGAFAVLVWFESKENDNLQLDDISGLGKKYPYACGALAFFMFAMAGFPPMAGFLGKFFVFSAALDQELYSIVIIGVIGSCISLYYYLRVIVKAYLSEPSRFTLSIMPQRSYVLTVVIAVSVILSLMLGTIWPNDLMKSMKVIALGELTPFKG